MSWKVGIGHPLKRDGTSQRARPMHALLPANNPIDSRTIQDTLVYAFDLAEKIVYVDSNNNNAGSWEPFFSDDLKKIQQLLTEKTTQEERSVEPHLALFVTFLRLLELLKVEINNLTQRHLVFYYEQVLGFRRKEAQSDKVHVLFQLAKQRAQEKIPADTVFTAGKDAGKQPLYYKTIHEIVVNQAKVKEVKTSFFDGPFTIHKVPSDKPFFPFGGFSSAAELPFLEIILENLVPESQVSIFFQIIEGTAELQEGVKSADITWGYYSASGWTTFRPTEILLDSTNNLQSAGIIRFQIPDSWDTGFSSSIFCRWNNVNNKSPKNAAKVLDIQTQGVVAMLDNRDNAIGHFENGLEANKIKNLEIRNSAIRKVKQPYRSFGGKPIEKDQDFFARVSERLRHKQRAITIWDYEHLVLNEYSGIYKVKTISHTGRNDDNTYSEFKPGQVEVVVIPQIKDVNLVNALEPMASNALRAQIHNYLAEYHSTFVDLRVSNPRYEPIKLDFKVGFRKGFDPSFYREVLNGSIKHHLSPWAFGEGADIAFGGKIYKSQLLTFVENQEYVDYITEFKLLHDSIGGSVGEMCVDIDLIVAASDGQEVEIAEASTAKSILVSAATHNIRVLLPDEYPCEDSALCEDGIGCMIVNIDFIVGKN